MQVENAVLPTREQAAATLKGAEGGPVTMLNFLKFKAHADYSDGEKVSGETRYGRYSAGFAPLLKAADGRIIYSGKVRRLVIGACEDLWEAIAVVEHPSSEVFARIVNSPEYEAIARHRVAGLAGQRNIETTARVAG